MSHQRQELDRLEPLTLVAIRRVSNLMKRANAAGLSDVESKLFDALVCLTQTHTMICDRALKTLYSSGKDAISEQPEDLPF